MDINGSVCPTRYWLVRRRSPPLERRARSMSQSVRRLMLIVGATLGVSSCATWPFGRAPDGLSQNIAVPDSFVVAFETSRGRFDVMARKNWAPVGVDRLYSLVRARHYDGAYFFRVVKDFVA